MKRRIIAFRQDENQDWVAELECGHGYHLRHNPPWQERAWVLTPEGRENWIGRQLDCVKCEENQTASNQGSSDTPTRSASATT